MPETKPILPVLTYRPDQQQQIFLWICYAFDIRGKGFEPQDLPCLRGLSNSLKNTRMFLPKEEKKTQINFNFQNSSLEINISLYEKEIHLFLIF